MTPDIGCYRVENNVHNISTVYVVLNMTPDIDCDRVGAVPKTSCTCHISAAGQPPLAQLL